MREIHEYEGLTIGFVTVVRKIKNELFEAICEKGHTIEVPRHKLYRGKVNGWRIKCPKCRLFPERCQDNAAWNRWSAILKRARKQGISVCERWNKFSNFYEDMGSPPKDKVIDRISNAKGYEPGNCRWASYKLSTENRKNTVWIKYKGRKMRVARFAKLIGCPESRVYQRLKAGWSISQIINPRKMNGFFRTGKAINASSYRKK